MKIKIILVLCCMFILSALSGCADSYGRGGEGLPLVKVHEAVSKPDLIGKEVRLEGKIIAQCLSNGCWFIMGDDTGKIMVDLKYLNLGLPQRTGRQVDVNGIVTRLSDGQVIISARGLTVS